MDIKNFALRITDDQYNKVIEHSKQLGISRNACIQIAIHAYFNNANINTRVEQRQDRTRINKLKRNILISK